MSDDPSAIPILYEDKVQIHCQNIGEELMHLGGEEIRQNYIPKYKKAKFVRKVKLKCVKLKKRPHYLNRRSQKHFNRLNSRRLGSQMFLEHHTNHQSHISTNNGRKIKGTHILSS